MLRFNFVDYFEYNLVLSKWKYHCCIVHHRVTVVLLFVCMFISSFTANFYRHMLMEMNICSSYVIYSLVGYYIVHILIMLNIYTSGDEPYWRCKRKSCSNGG